MKNRDDLPIIAFATPQDWETWLEAHHANPQGVWLKLAKKQSGIPSVTYAEALIGALCYGWIDGQKVAFDGDYWLQKFTPRRPRSIWSQVNCDKAATLIAEGKMRPAGLQQVEAAKGDGRWQAAYASPRAITVPDDLRSELDKNPAASAFFDTLNASNRYAILWRIHTAKKSETRAARIQQFVAMLSNGEKIHP